MGALFFKNKKEQIGKISKSFFELSAKDIDGQLINFSTFQTYKAIIVVNVASSCGLTKSNYRELNELYEKYQYLKIFSVFFIHFFSLFAFIFYFFLVAILFKK